MHPAIAHIGTKLPIPPEFDWSTLPGATYDSRAEDLVLADGAAVSSWADTIGGRVSTEATNRPTFRATGANGKPGVEFDGINDMMTDDGTIATVTGTGDFCAVVILKINAITSTSTADLNAAIFQASGVSYPDGIGAIGAHLAITTGTYKLQGSMYNGAWQRPEYDMGATFPTNTIVAHWRRVGGFMWVGYNNVESLSIPVGLGASYSAAKPFQWGKCSYTAQYASVLIAERKFKTDGTLPSSAIASYMAKYS